MASTTDAPTVAEAKAAKPQAEPKDPKETPEKSEITDSKVEANNGAGLLADPKDTLERFREIARTAAKAMPEQFGSFLLNVPSEIASLTVRPGTERPQSTDFNKKPDLVLQPLPFERKENTRIHGTGSNVDTKVEIRYDKDGKANFVRDHIGEWQSTDGGNTWKTGMPNFRIRRGEVSIDAKGDYNFENTDYGVKSKMSKDGSSTRTIKSADGDTYSVTRDKKGVATSFTDKDGEWKNDGKSWLNEKTGEKKNGTPQITEFGEFKFKPDKGITQTAQTEQRAKVEKLQSEISKEFGVIFAQPGETKRNPHEQAEGGMGPGGLEMMEPEPELKNGVPTVQELETLKDVMTNTNHENYRGVKVWFIRPDENDSPMLARYENDGRGKPTPEHTHAGDCCSKRGIQRSQNGDMVILPLSRVETKGIMGLEGTLYHELGHHEQFSKFNKALEMLGPEGTKASAELAKEMGWQYNKRLDTGVIKDKTGGLWKFDPENGKFRWSGGQAPADGERRLSSLEMREKALVKPITPYFDNPNEMHAEALAMYRIGERADVRGGRQYLASESPALYDVIKKFDQKSIDMKMGKDADGHSKYVRNVDGKIVENNADVQRRISEKEQEWKSRGSIDPAPPRSRKK